MVLAVSTCFCYLVLAVSTCYLLLGAEIWCTDHTDSSTGQVGGSARQQILLFVVALCFCFVCSIFYHFEGDNMKIRGSRYSCRVRMLLIQIS